ncbi:hypothetical protein [Haloprofundus salinisoli]|uniref:hypothetical protein n=1 Tax=Haloprofundus salinisoli TaxID=2876193 RepID=UPI001CCEE0BE|nr:hypothetical protein [Haloprofundus salinisoli]
MRPSTRSIGVAAGGILAALATFVYSWSTLSSASTGPRGDGFVAGLLVAFGLALGLAATFVAASALILAVAERFARLEPRQRLILQLGAAANVAGTVLLFLGSGLGRLPQWFETSVSVSFFDVTLYLWGAWVALTLVGTAVSVLGGLWTIAGALMQRRSARTSV